MSLENEHFPLTADQWKGDQLMYWGNALTNFRKFASPVLGAITAATDENWVTTGLDAVTAATDMEGMLVRRGAELCGVETSPQGAIDDPEADKAFVNFKLLGLAGRFARQGDLPGAAIVGTNLLASRWRDNRMRRNRAMVDVHKLDPNELKALKVNKLKTALQFGSVVTLSSPAARQARVRYGALAGLSVGTAIGIYGERKYRTRVNSLIAAKLTADALKCPDEIELEQPLPYKAGISRIYQNSLLA